MNFWERLKIFSLYIQSATIKCENIEDKMWVGHRKSHVLIPLKAFLCLNGMNEAILKVVKDLFAWRDSHF